MIHGTAVYVLHSFTSLHREQTVGKKSIKTPAAPPKFGPRPRSTIALYRRRRLLSSSWPDTRGRGFVPDPETVGFTHMWTGF